MSLTVVQLKDLAKKKGISYPTKILKKDLEILIAKHDKKVPSSVTSPPITSPPITSPPSHIVPQIIPRNENIPWSDQETYKFPIFSDMKWEYNDKVGKKLPLQLEEVLNSFTSNIDTKGWKVDWNENTPALQYHNTKSLFAEVLPAGNIFKCSLEDEYFEGLCENGTKKTAESVLIGKQLESWRKDKFGEYTVSKYLTNPKVVSMTQMKMGLNNSTTIKFTDKDGYTASKRFPVAKDKVVFPLTEDIKGSKNITCDIIFTDEVINKYNPRVISVGKIRKDAIEYLAQNYKIRFQVKPEYQIWMTQELLNLFSTDEIGKYIETFKCSLVYSKIYREENRLASIVLYVQPGKEIAQKVLTKLQTHFAGCEYIGLNLPSRYNIKVNDMLYYSGGDGDMKLAFSELGIIDKYFDRTKGYAFFIGYNLN